MTGDKKALYNLKKLTFPIRVHTVSGPGSVAYFEGSMKIDNDIEIRHVLYVPGCPYTIMSLGKIADSGFQTLIEGDSAYILAPKTIRSTQIQQMVLLEGQKVHGVYVLTEEVDQPKKFEDGLVMTPVEKEEPRVTADTGKPPQDARRELDEAQTKEIQGNNAEVTKKIQGNNADVTRKIPRINRVLPVPVSMPAGGPSSETKEGLSQNMAIHTKVNHGDKPPRGVSIYSEIARAEKNDIKWREPGSSSAPAPRKENNNIAVDTGNRFAPLEDETQSA